MAAETEASSGGVRVPGGKPVAMALLAVLSVAGAAGGYFLAMGLGGTSETEQEMAHAATAGGSHEAATESHAAADDGHGKSDGHGEAKPTMSVTPFKEIIVNISATTATGRTTSRFMKLNVALVYDERKEGADRIEERRLFLRDSFQDYLRQLTEQDLQGSLGLVLVKEELLHRARTITESRAPSEILIADLIVQ